MEIQAVTKGVKISTRKVRLVADAVRHQSLTDALGTLHMVKKRGASALEKTLRSAMANAVNNAHLDVASLTISQIEISEGVSLKRFHASTRGRVHPYKKRSSHIRVVLSANEKKGETKV
ncbi:50S ribosomal protein L22 [soil metagenome]